MNTIYLNGTIKNIEHSHVVNGVDYDKANLIVTNSVGKEDIISVRFKHLSNRVWKDGDFVELLGNIRSYSKQIKDYNGNDKNKVEIYVYSHLDDVPQEIKDSLEPTQTNYFEIDGRICKNDGLREFKEGKCNTHFTIANNIYAEHSKLNSYLPVVTWGSLARFAQSLKVSDRVLLKGELHSREYVKQLEDGTQEIKVAHELLCTNIEVIGDEENI